MTLSEAILEANEQGWYVYQLYQEGPTNDWHCCLRSVEPFNHPYRHEISRSSGDDPLSAICNALGAAPELEAEVSIVDLRGLDDRASPPVDLMKMFVKREPINRRL